MPADRDPVDRAFCGSRHLYSFRKLGGDLNNNTTKPMIVEAEVLSERANEYTGKKGKVEQTILSCIDRSPDHAFVNTFDYLLTPEEREKYRGKLGGKRVTLGLINARPEFGGRLRFDGSLVKIH